MFKSQRFFAGPTEAVILDWAGTTIDFGSLAPVSILKFAVVTHWKLQKTKEFWKSITTKCLVC